MTRICSQKRMNDSKTKSSKKDEEHSCRRLQQDETDAPQNPNKPSSDDVVSNSDVDNGTKLRRMLGLIATVESESSSTQLPDPYAESCLEDNCEEDDSLIKLAKHTFKKLASKVGTKKWSPTPIQLQSWPILKSDSSKKSSLDTKHTTLIAIATTGSGKTLGYAVPMIDSCAMVQGKQSRRYVHGLVIVPTRELALQVSKVLKAVTKSANKLSEQTEKIVALPIYGGVSREEQVDSLLSKNSQYIVAATPLRLIDLLGIGDKDGNGKKPVPNKRIQCLFEPMRYLVIDEADQMATKSDMSQQVDLILNFLREKCTQLDRQCLFSATLPRRAVAKCNDWIELPRVTVKVDTVTVGEAMAKNGDSASGGKAAGALDLSTIPSHITQTLHVCSNHKKEKKLMITINKIRQEEKERGDGRGRGLLIIFFGRIKTLQRVHVLLQKDNIQGVALHSQMNQQNREKQLNLFRSGKCPILLATDVAARGIHINNVFYVINYDFPGSLEQYVHRCGRAGRSKVSGRVGDDKTEKTSIATVYSFFNRELAPMANDMVDLLRSCNAWVDPNLIALVPGGIKKGDGESKRKRRKRDKTKSDGPDAIDNSTTPNATAKNANAKKTSNTPNAKKMIKPPNAKKRKSSSDVENIGVKEDVEDDFPDLAPNRIVLKRASHVSYSDSEEDDAS